MSNKEKRRSIVANKYDVLEKTVQTYSILANATALIRKK